MKATPSMHFTTADRIRILEEYDSYPRGDERRGLLLRRHGVYTSQIAKWRARLARGDQSLDPLPPGPKRPPVHPLAAEVARLTQENTRLHAQLAKAEAIIEIQKKVATLLGTTVMATSDGSA